MFSKSISPDPWDDWVDRVVIHVPHYLSPAGEPTSGGRQRKVRDIARLIRDTWGRDCVIVQKAERSFETVDRYGFQVIGVRAHLSVLGDPQFGRSTSRVLRPRDGMLYLGGEDAWPFIVSNSKGFHVGVWWDGPFPLALKALTAMRTEGLFRRARSMACCDTNVVNWLRARAASNQGPANRAVYIPNCVDLDLLRQPEPRMAPQMPLRVLFARRFERKRGPELALDMVVEMKNRARPVRITMATAEGQAGSVEIRREAAARGIERIVNPVEANMETVMDLYAQHDVVVVPTLWSEGTSYSCVEALAAGLPVVTTTVGGLPNLVFPGFNGFVVPPTPNALADALEDLMDKETWSECHRNALAMRPSLSKSHWDRRVLRWLRT